MKGMDEDLSTGTWAEPGDDGAPRIRIRTCRLDVVSGPDAGLTRTMAASAIRIGRAGSDLVLTDRKVSGIHAEIRLEAGGYRLRDLGSTNGTWVRGMRVIEVFVEPGETFTLGETTVRFAPQTSAVEVPVWREPRLGSLVGRSAGMRQLFAAIDRVSASDATVLITGESGTGKELVAEELHRRSPRASGPFVVLDCGAVPAALFESQLFGHEKGAFTDAVRTMPGSLELAAGGTLFLDEIGELPAELQTKLLRAVETRTVRRVGGTELIEHDVRIVAATNRDLAAEVNRGAFRQDLYYRLAVVELHIPPLRDRLEDVELLIDALAGSRRAELPEGFVEWARRSPWPGNVRQLRNAVERSLALGDYASATFPAADGAPERPPPVQSEIDLRVPFREAKQRVIDDFDRRYITALLRAHDNNISAAARAAGLDRMSIYKALDRLGLAHDD